jgi:hypothetical protein
MQQQTREQKVEILRRELENIRQDVETGKQLFRRTETATTHLARAIKLLAKPSGTQKARST